MISVAVTTVKPAAAAEPKLTPVVPVKSVPAMVMVPVPPSGPATGLRAVTVGAI